METATQALHRITSYRPDREWTDAPADPRAVLFEPNDLDRLPWFTKRYADDRPRVPLPRDLPTTAAPAMAVLAGSVGGVGGAERTGTAEVPATAPDLPALARLLHLSAGVVRTMQRPYGTFLFRAAGSAGGRFPLELYVAVPAGTALPPGVHWYDPRDHALVEVGPPPRAGVPTVVVTGVPWRTGWRYRERGYRHMYWDAGTMLAQLLAAADSAGLAPALRTGFPDAAVAALVGADRVHELPVAIVTLGDGQPALDATGPAATGAVDATPVEFPLVTDAQRAGERDGLGPVWDRGEPVAVTAAGGTVEAVILARGSVRRLDPARGLPADVLRAAMEVAVRGVDRPHFVVVHDVAGLAPGVYRWPDVSAPVRAGRLRDELYRVCLEQGLARDAAFVVVTAADVAALDDHGYRDAQLAAGLVEGRLHLAAYALGAAASGMTFLDSEMPALLGEPLDALLFTCVGVADYRGATGGAPGAPTEVRRVTERL